MTDIRVLHRRALQVAVDAADQVRPDQLGLPTPCAKWDLEHLLAHMTGQNHGFAQAARGRGGEMTAWQDRPVGDDPGATHAASAADLAAAFAEEGVLGRAFLVPEIRVGRPFPATMAIGFHLVDCVAHAWDVARCLGNGVEFDDELLATVLRLVEQIPDDESREQPGAAFAHRVSVEAGAGALDRILALLGRSANWTP
jgi:uncharacterized protein (TIGR03086 family)